VTKELFVLVTALIIVSVLLGIAWFRLTLDYVYLKDQFAELTSNCKTLMDINGGSTRDNVSEKVYAESRIRELIDWGKRHI
jgi:cell division protein YceG involved in septum cleavage